MSAAEKILWLDATAGASGDMILGALVDLGAPFAAVKRAVAGLGLRGVRLTRHAVARCAVAATKIDVRVAGHAHDEHHVHTGRRRGGHGRSLSDIRKIVAGAPIEPAVRDRALVVFRRLVEAEAEAHGLTVKNVHLHESGAADAIADVVGVCAALHAIAPDRIVVSPMTTGSGTVACAHGLYPVPGPATGLLLRGAPLTGIAADGERLTPTGAAILTSIANEYGGPPAMTLQGVGHGAGSREYPERPNVLRALLGERCAADRPAAMPRIPQVLVVEFTVDDATPQLLAYGIERLFAAGALDVHTTPVQMKKGRAGHQITALTHLERFDAVTRAALTETTTLGLRFHLEGRIELDRATERVATRYGAIRVKVGRLDGAEVHATPEYDDCAAAARKHGVALFAVQQAALDGASPRKTGRGKEASMSRKPFYLTTPIYYVNDEPHIGHTYTTVVADAVARYRRATGWDVRFLTGTDEHGQKIERAAAKLGIEPIALADRVVSRYRELWKRLSISHDDFIRTTEARHRRGVDRLIEKMTAAGDVYLGSYDGMYCAGCEAFYPESQVVNGTCPDQGHPVEAVREASYFFRLSKYQEPLLAWIDANPNAIRPLSRRNEVRAFIASGLKDLSISRTTIHWGIPWPHDPAHIVYVWVDALTNYMSALGFGSADETLFSRYWPAAVHLVGKDIVRFHAVYWPAFLMSAGLPLPECVFAHGWWLKDEAKMSKSLGNVVRPGPLLDAVGPDALRYFLLREMSFGLDGSYSDEQLLDRYNGDLANELGNVTSRVIALCDSGFAGTLPPASTRFEASELLPVAREAHAAWRAAFDDYDFSSGLSAVWTLAASLNRFLQTHAPWALAKDPTASDRHAAVLRGACEALLQIAAMASPAMPGACADIAARLGTSIPGDLSEFRWGLLPAGASLVKRGPLFPRIDKAGYFEETKTMTDAKPVEAGSPAPELLSIDDFLRVDLRVALVTAAERIEGTDKLLKLKLDLGGPTRQIVAGIAKAYAPEQLVGKKIVVVCNLKPAKLRGVESQGMLLAADLDGRPFVATFDEDVKPGTRVR